MRGSPSTEQPFLDEIRQLLGSDGQAFVFDHLIAQAQEQLFDEDQRQNVLESELETACSDVAKAMGKAHPLPRESISFARPANIYIASEIYESGGHGRILEQMIAGRPHEQHIVLFTGLLTRTKEYSIRRVSAAGAFPVYADTQSSMYDRYLWLREKLAAYAAHRVIFFHHPQDALAAVAAYEMAPRYGKRLYIYRHTDTGPALGAGLESATHIAFRKEQQELITKQTPNISPVLLPLVYAPTALQPAINAEAMMRVNTKAEDRHFFPTGTLTTATCGGEHKFTTSGSLAFGAVIAKALQSTRGIHFHIGAASDDFQRKAYAELEDNNIAPNRLKFLGDVHSVAEVLAYHDVGFLLNSFPIGGGLVALEAAYAGTPMMIYRSGKATQEESYMAGSSHIPPETSHWSSATDLASKLQRAIEKDLRDASARGKKWYERYFTPERFHQRVSAIYRANEVRITQTTKQAIKRIMDQASDPAKTDPTKAGMFDSAFYLKRYEDVARAGLKANDHFNKHGQAEHRAPNPLFDGAYYLRNLPASEHKLAQDSPLGHYVARGETMGYQPHPLFNPDYYRHQVDPADVSESLLQHYLTHGADKQPSPHCLFDVAYYVRQLTEQSFTEPAVVHFLASGASRGIDPHPLIQIRRFGQDHPAQGFVNYLSQAAPSEAEISPHLLFSPAVFASGNPHFFAPAAPNLLWAHVIEGDVVGRDPHALISIQYLQRTGATDRSSASVCLRQIAQNRNRADTHPLVDFSYISKQAPWVATLDTHVLAYFLEHCVSHNIDPHPYFSVQYYLFKNQDVAQSGTNPLLHYLASGQYEGRWPHPFFDGSYYYHAHIGQQTEERRPLVHYIEHGAAHFLHVQQVDTTRVEMGQKLASRLFKLGDLDGAKETYQDALHPDTAFEHPSLSCSTIPFEGNIVSRIQQEPAGNEIVSELVFRKAHVVLDRPRVLSPVHIAPKIGNYTAPEVTAAVFEYVTLIAGNEGFITETGGWCDDGLAEFDQKRMSLKDIGSVVEFDGDNLLLRQHKTTKTLAAGIHASGTYSRNYFHFLIEVLPRIIAAAKLAPQDTPILADSDMPTQHLQAIQSALPKNPIRQILRNSGYTVRKLYTASMGNLVQDVFGKDDAPIDAVRYHPEVLNMLRETGQKVASASKSRKIFLRRNSGVRRVLNQDELQAFFVSRGFDVVECERLSFAEQVSLFAAADVIVGQSGAQLANMIFARPGTKIYTLYSNAPGTNYYLWSGLGQHLGLEVVNVAGWRLAGSAEGNIQTVHEDFTVPLNMLSAFFDEAEDDDVAEPSEKKDDTDLPAKTLLAALDTLYDANTKADMLTGCWGLLGEDTPDGFDDVLAKSRSAALLALQEKDGFESSDMETALAHPFFADYGRNIRSGFAALPITQTKDTALAKTAMEQLSALNNPVKKPAPKSRDLRSIFGSVKKLAKSGDDADASESKFDDLRRTLGAVMLTAQAYQAPIVANIEDWPDDVRARYLNWLLSPPFCYREGEDAKYVAFVQKLLVWLAEKLTATKEPLTQSAVSDVATRIDLGTLLVVDQPVREISTARNTILETLAASSGEPRKELRTSGRKRIGILCRTFDKGPDSEAVISFFKTFDKSRYEIFAYSVGFQDRVVKADPEFDRLFDRTIEHRRLLGSNPRDVRAEILSDDLDVFLYANATTYGIQSLDLALFNRVAPIQMVLNCHVPMALGYPAFDYYVTGKSDDPKVEPAQNDYAETLLRLPGPVINYQNSLLKDSAPLFDREKLGLKNTDVVLLNAGSLSKLRHECLHTMLRAVKACPNGVLVLAPYNPGWVARSQAFAFNRQLMETAAEVGVSADQIRVMGELSVAEAESILQLSDIYLNPFPHGGATMTHLALIYGKPPVTMRRRSTRSIDQFLINSLGCDSLLVNSTDEYVARVEALAKNPEERLALSNQLKTDAAKPVFVDNPDYSDEMLAIVDEVVAKRTSQTKDN